ncbi:hypothetical protein J2S70_000147 [Trueperella bonasi]|uniref:Copper transporter n=1 Tax=Trueperella bonasi TaxID=312286 RepID=A0ABT9NDU8_9ACTO|nr:copper transporter [Trueperella bonasi]MDP9805565.1 hypothetical protein [Trueperella bonasi]
MVDFRYHLVSLISVFFALAIGIILGAGPLQESLGNVLQSQVSDLRTTNMELKAQNEELERAIGHQEQAFEDVAPVLIGDTLSGQTISLVVLPGVTDREVSAVQARIEDAGASVSGVATLKDTWTLASQNSFRSTFADQITEYVPGAEDGAETNQVLALAVNAITRDGVAKHDTLAGLMTGTDTPMMSIDAMVEPASAVLVLTPDIPSAASETVDPDLEAQQQYTTSTHVSLIIELGSRGPTVAAGAGGSEGDVIYEMRGMAAEVSTVDSIDLIVGQINAPIALATELRDGLIHLGIESGAQRVLGERVEARAVEPAAPPAEPADESADGEEAGTVEPVDGEGEPVESEDTSEEAVTEESEG